MGRSYPHLSLKERRKIAKWREAKMPVPEIAERLDRAASTIYRELKRKFFHDKELPELNGYYVVNAQDMYERRRAVHRKLIVHPQLKAAIEDRLKAGWSPEQIAGRMRLERHPVRITHETIYRFAYSKDGRAEAFYRHLPEHRKRRRPRGYRCYQRTSIHDRQSLSQRPPQVSDRQEFGHWECDLMMFRKEHGKVNVTSLVERVSRYAVVMRNEDRQSKPIMEALIRYQQLRYMYETGHFWDTPMARPEAQHAAASWSSCLASPHADTGGRRRTREPEGQRLWFVFTLHAPAVSGAGCVSWTHRMCAPAPHLPQPTCWPACVRPQSTHDEVAMWKSAVKVCAQSREAMVS